jgi:hypothetical protein
LLAGNILPSLVPIFRKGLMIKKADVVEVILQALTHLANALSVQHSQAPLEQQELQCRSFNAILSAVLGSIAGKMNDKKYRDLVQAFLLGELFSTLTKATNVTVQ